MAAGMASLQTHMSKRNEADRDLIAFAYHEDINHKRTGAGLCTVRFWVLLGGVWDHMVCSHIHAEPLQERLKGLKLTKIK